MYNISFTADDNQDRAFTIAPTSGYQEINLYMYITDFRLLDYEDPNFRDFTITVKDIITTYVLFKTTRSFNELSTHYNIHYIYPSRVAYSLLPSWCIKP